MSALDGMDARRLAAALAAVDVAFLVALVARAPIVRPLVGPEDEDLATWTAGVVATYVVAQAAIAVRPTAAAARALATLRAVLIGGDLAVAWRGGKVGRLGVPTAVGNAALALLALRAAGGAGTTGKTRGRALPRARAGGVNY